MALAVAFAPVAAYGQTFTNVTAGAGISHVYSTPQITNGMPGAHFLGGGVAAGDFDGDGRTDLFFTRLGDVDILYRNLGDGTFQPQTAAAGFTIAANTNAVVSGDVDNDGDLDLYVTETADGARNYLYLNNGQGVFADAGASRTVALDTGITRHGQGSSFGDLNNDGYLDLVTADWGNEAEDSHSRLFENRGAAQPGVFDDITVASGIDVYRKDITYRFAPRLVDLDRDGHLDLAVASDFETSQLFWNNGDGTFVDGTLPAGVGTDRNGMGSTFGDYDGDGDLDWFITNITPSPEGPPAFGGFNRLYRNDGNRQFTDVTLEAGVRDSRWAWGTSFFDYDNDGDLDLIATNGYNGAGWIDDRTYLWQNNNGVFTDVSEAAGITDTGQGRGLAHLDFDDDGDLDIVIVNNGAAPILYRNDGGNANDFLQLELEGTISNRDAIGAFITLTPNLQAPGERMVWDVDGGSSFLSQNERTAHFGLGWSAGAVDLVTIRWPSGLVQHLHEVAPNQTLDVVETHQQTVAGDVTFDRQIDADDVDWIRTAGDNPGLYEQVFGVVAVSVADLTENGAIDEGDVEYLLSAMLNTEYGDLNIDQAVDAADVAKWQAGFGETEGARYADGEVNGDAKIAGGDFLAMQRNIGFSSAAARAVPEPSAAWLVAVAAACYRWTAKNRGAW